MQISFLHQIDARSKLLLTVTVALATIVFSGYSSLLILFVASFILALFVKRPLLLLLLYALMGLMVLLSVLCMLVMGLFIPQINEVGFSNVLIPFLRGLIMMNIVMSLALTTQIEHIMTALAQLRLPFFITLPSTVMIRFIPTFASDVAQVWETLRIRGWSLGWKMLLKHPLLSSRLIFVPILFRALKSSEALGVAAELKGLDRGLQANALSISKCSLSQYKNDWILLISAGLSIGLATYCEYFGISGLVNLFVLSF